MFYCGYFVLCGVPLLVCFRFVVGGAGAALFRLVSCLFVSMLGWIGFAGSVTLVLVVDLVWIDWFGWVVNSVVFFSFM